MSQDNSNRANPYTFSMSTNHQHRKAAQYQQQMLAHMEQLVAQEKYDEAIELLGPVVASNPGNPRILHLMADLYKQSGDLVQAESYFRRAMKANPKDLGPYFNMGLMFSEKENYKEAEKVFKKAIKVAPDSALAHGHLGAVLQHQNRLQDALKEMKRSEGINPDNPKIHNNLGVVYQRQNQPETAKACYEKSIELDEKYLEPKRNLARYWSIMGEPDQAEDHWKAIMDEHPGSWEDASELAEFYIDHDRSSEAMEIYEKFEDSENAGVLSQIGSSLQVIGDTGKGEDILRNALAINPSFGGAWFQLVPALGNEELKASIPKMKAGLKDKKITDHNKQSLYFALGRAFEKLKDSKNAYTYLKNGNDLKRQSYDYSTESEKEIFDGIKKAYSKKFSSQWQGKGCDNPTPIFILGMPRSGTTLTEQIIASHPEVFGAGELMMLQGLESEIYQKQGKLSYPDAISKLTEERIKNLGERYVSMVREQHSDSAKFITDKMPGNFLRLGMIRTILPEAKIVHVIRDPRDNCWSIYKQNFGGYHPYAYNLKELGEYHRLYQDLMNHWREVYPDQFYEIEYEKLVNNPEQESRRLVEYCGLDWHDDCLNFHKKERAIKTASKLQVRQPMYKTSVSAWEPFRNEIKPLLKALNME